MSSKKLVCFLVISIIYGLIAVGGAHASIVGIKGVITDAEGMPLAGVRVEALDFGSIPVTAVTDDSGAYSIPYISFANVVIKVGDEIVIEATDADGDVVKKTHIVTAADITAGQATFNIIFVSTTVTVAVDPTIFSADRPGTGTVTVTVEQDGPITDETVTLSLSPAVGTVSSPATNNGDGTYTATYTSGGAAGNVRVTATATGANASGAASITINAGSPAAIALTAVPDTVSSLGRSIITAMVSDNKGNGVGGVSLTGAASNGGTLTNFASAAIFGTYTATYTAPMVDAEGADMITVTTDDISAEVTVNLTPVPPREVTILTVDGTVFKEDGEIPADNIKVTVTVGTNSPQMDTTDTDGNYSVTLFSPLATVARTGDPVSIVVTDATDAKRGEASLILNNDYLGEDGTGAVTDANVTTDIVIPPRSVSVLSVEGVIYSDDGSPIEDVDITVTVTIGANPPAMAILGEDGTYSVTAVNLLGTVASTGDMVSTVVVTDADGAERGRANMALSNKQLGETGSATVTLDVNTDITLPPKSVNILVVEGVVYRDDETSPVGPGLDVAVTVGSNPVLTTQTESDGSFAATFTNLTAPVASSGDAVSIVVSDGSGERGRDAFTLKNADLGDADAATVTRKVSTNIGATSGVLAVTGTVFFKNGDSQSVPAASHLREGDLTVVVTNTTRNLKASGSVDDDGGYDVTFLNLLGIVAETGDSLTLEVEVLNEAGDAVGRASHTLTTSEVLASSAKVDIHTTVPAQIRILDVTGSVVEINGSPAGPGLEVSIAIAINGHSSETRTVTDAAGRYEHTFVDLLNPVAATGNVLRVDVLRASDQFRGHAVIELRSYELVDQQITVDPIALVPPLLKLGGLSINPSYTGIQDPVIQEFLNVDLVALATTASALVGNDASGNPLVALPPSLPLLISPILAAVGAFQIELPSGFDPTNENIAQESFGNAITTRPTAWAALSAASRLPGRWVTGDQLNLYISGAPTIESVTFTLNGMPTAATSIPAGGSFMYTFQLEEELVGLLSGEMPAFTSVELRIDGQEPISMTPNSMGVWSVDAALSPGSTVAYYYWVELAQPYHDSGLTIKAFAHLDPHNRQLITDGLSETLEGLLESDLSELKNVRSVFSVPAVDDLQSLWVAALDLDADGPYQLDTTVVYRGGHTDPINGQMFIVDRTPPTTDVALNPNDAGVYMRDDGTYVATGPMPGAASITVSTKGASANEPDGAAGYIFQFAQLDGAGNPGTWNPVLKPDLLPLYLETLLIDPASVLPMTGGGPIEMLIRNSEGGALMGTYGLRAVGVDSLLNVDSSRGHGVVVNFVPPDADVAMVTAVQSDFDGNGAIEGLEMQYTSGDVAVFSDSMVELIVNMRQRTAHPLKSIVLEFQLPGGDWQPIGMFGADQLASTMRGDELSVALPVPDFPMLPDRGAHIMVRTVTTNALDIVNEDVFSAVYERRTPPEVSAVHTYMPDRHPDSGAAQGTITVSAFTQAMTSPSAAAVQLEIRRAADAEWAPLGIVQIANTTVTSHVQIAIIEDLVNAIVGGAAAASVDPLYREWPLTVDSATFEDTIMDDSPAASDASLDDNPYVVRAIVVDTLAAKYESAAGVTDSFSLDNYSPTAIAQAENEVEMIMAREDGSYHFGGLVAEGVPDPMLTLTAWTGAHPNAFPGGLKLAVNDAEGEAAEIAETVFEIAGNHNHTAAFNLGSLPNGMYTFMAVAHTAEGAVEERIVAMAVDVEVGNFTPPDNFADPTVDIVSVINTRGDVHSPSEIDAQYATGFPAIDDKVCVTLTVPNVAASDIDVLIGDDLMSAAMMAALTVMGPDADNNISICLDTSELDEGMYSLVGVVSKANGSVQFGLPSIRIDRTAPVIEIVSPLEAHQVSSLPTVQVNYSDDTGFDPEQTEPYAVDITLTRLGSHKAVPTNPEMIRAVTAAGEVLTQSGSLSYTHDNPLAGGAYRIDVSITDALGNTATADSVEVTSSGMAAGVSIITPASGQVVAPDQPLTISAALSGNGEITVSELSLNGTAATPTVENNMLTHTVDPDGVFKRGAGNTVTIKIVDEEGNTAEATSTFTLALDKTPPVVATYSPLGIIRTDRPIAAATVTDESGIKRDTLRIIIAGVPGNQGTGRRSSATSTTVTFTPSISVTPGPYTARVTVEDVYGNRTEVEWQFTVELDVTPPTITTSSPHGVIRSDKPIISVSASDDMSGVDTIEIGVKGEGNQTVEGVTSVRSDKTAATFTPTGALTSGTYTVDVKLADMSGNKASGQWQFTIELDTIAPSIFDTRPSQEHTEHRRPTISATYTDNMSGVDAGSVKLTLDGSPVEPDALSDTQVVYTPKSDLTFGPHTVKLEVSDLAPSANTAVQEWTFYVERMGIADARNYPNPFDHETTIAFRLSRQASITIRIYDFTGRLVSEPITNSVREAGPVEIEWHNETSGGDHLARGVYFCHILMESELAPQSAILKMAVISE